MGNRVKGKIKPKSKKAALSSATSSKRKLSRMGKKRKKDLAGLDATFISRSSCLKRLQITLKDFRRLCILKGIYPREPRRTPKNKKNQVYYHIKDMKAIAHEPILQKFRDFKAFMKRVRRCSGRKEKEEAKRLMDEVAPTYTLHHLVKERYPRFVDALGDLDDALSLTYLFACLPSQGRIQAKVTSKAKELCAAWGAYCGITHAISKSFISVKGVYLEVNIENTAIRWVMPHAFTQHLPVDVDYRVMVTFFEFYQVLLGFVLYKLYNDIGVRYPFVTSHNSGSSVNALIAAHLRVLNHQLSQENTVSHTVTAALHQSHPSSQNKDTIADRTPLLPSTEILSKINRAQNESGIDSDDEDDKVDITQPLEEALADLAKHHSNDNDKTRLDFIPLDEESTKRKKLFSNLTFFLSREIPRGYLELVCLSYGARVGWEGDDSPIGIHDKSITHHIVDRPKLLSSYDTLPKNREFIQPQWVLDCANHLFLLPVGKYGPGAELPPHLSPWVDNEEEGYKPKYAEEIEKLKNGEVMDTEEEDNVDMEQEEQKEIEEKSKMQMEQEKEDESDKESSDEEKEDDDEEDEEKDGKAAAKRKKQEEEETQALAKVMMSKKASRLYGRMQHGIQEKQKTVETLERKRKEIEFQKGKTPLKQKVERLKKERKEVEKQYDDNAGSMKKRSRRRKRGK